MSDVLLTPLMNLPNPVPGSDPGPDYATNIYNSLSIIDGHNHSAGSGNLINVNGISVNADFPFNSFNATLLRSVRLAPQSAALTGATDLGCLFDVGGELYFNDGSGNHVKMTLGGSVNATSSGISSGTASAAFSGGVLIVNSNTNTPGNIQAGSVLIGNNSVGTKFVTVSAPSSLSANYPFVLPTALPGAQSFTSLDASGNMATTVAVSGGITSTNIAANGIARSNLPVVGQQVSASCGSFTSTSATFTDVTNLSVTITTTGRPVIMFLTSDGGGNGSFLGVTTNPTGGSASANFRILRGGTEIYRALIALDAVSGALESAVPPSSIFHLDAADAGTYTYKLQVATGQEVIVFRSVLVAYEL